MMKGFITKCEFDGFSDYFKHESTEEYVVKSHLLVVLNGLIRLITYFHYEVNPNKVFGRK